MNTYRFLSLACLLSMGGLAGCTPDATPVPPAVSSHFEELGVSFDYPAGWEILQSAPSQMGPTVIFSADGGNDDTDDIVLAMFMKLRENESGMNDKLLQGVYAGHEELLDQALIENYWGVTGEGRVTEKVTTELEATSRPGGFVIKQTCEADAGEVGQVSVERWFEVDDCAPNRVLLVSQQSTAEGREALREGLKEIRETLRFPSSPSNK